MIRRYPARIGSVSRRIGSVSRRIGIVSRILGLVIALTIAGCMNPVVVATDSDNDGVADTEDAFPDDPNETLDTDGDGEGNQADSDDDNDGVIDADDPDPLDANVDSIDPPDNPLGGALGESAPNLSGEQSDTFELGRAVFTKLFTRIDGVGPNQLGASCVGCHGSPVAGGSGTGAFVRVISVGEPKIVDHDAPPLFGAALFERVSDETILSMQDPTDADGDGISGRPNIDGDRIGRFGLKAQAATLESITRGMLVNQMGITSDPLAKIVRPKIRRPEYLAQIAPPGDGGGGTGSGDDNTPDPEIDAIDLGNLIAFQELLAAPVRGSIDLAVQRGDALFASIGCADCHVPSLPLDTGEMIYPYTDLLIHNMGEELSDATFQSAASGTEFRTAPLWGLTQSAPYIHDGRAETIDDAIKAHAGEAQTARDGYITLTDDEQADLIRFLESL
jgi:CxxC motif-containing protein (DUF1111 family)